MTPQELSALHAQCFTTPRPWSSVEFSELLGSTGVFLNTAENGFSLGRVAGPEVELLTLAVAPETRRKGTGRTLLAKFEATAIAKGATDALLEVAADNTAARSLYASAGYTESGRRERYYHAPDGTRIDALILRKPLLRA